MLSRTIGIAVLAMVLLTGSLLAQRMTAEQILDRADAASGGAKARQIKTFHMKGSFQMPAQNLNGTMEVYFKAPSKILVKQTIPGVLDSSQGFDGKVGWEKNSLTGLRELKGAELEQLRLSSDLNSVTNWRKQYRNPKLRGTDKVGKYSVYVIDASTPFGAKVTLYIDTKEFLPRRVDAEAVTPQGRLNVRTLFEDYRKIEGIAYPFVMRQSIAGIEMVIRIQQIRHNTPLNDSLFRKPTQ